MKTFNTNLFTLVLFMSLLTACGGGGSSSGSNDNKLVTQCISAKRISLKNSGFESEAQYTNTCDFAVSLGYELTLPSVKGPVSLQPKASHSDFLGATKEGKYIACRPPAKATNRGTNLDVRLKCS